MYIMTLIKIYALKFTVCKFLQIIRIMRQLLMIISVAILLTNCSSPKNDTENADTSTDSSSNSEIIEEEYSGTEGVELISELAGEYYNLQKEGSSVYYQAPCTSSPYDLKISETAEGSGEWTINWEEQEHTIAKAEKKEGDIYINTAAPKGMDFTFILSKSSTKDLWEFVELGISGVSTMAKNEDLENFEIKPCTDTQAIMKTLASQWFLVSKVEGKDVLFVPCEEAPGGFSIDAESYDNWSGVDPYEVLSVAKTLNEIKIVYKSIYGEDTQTKSIKNFNGTVLYVTNGNGEDELYIREDSKDIYSEVEEECG